MEKNNIEDVTMTEYTLLVNQMYKLHNETKQEFKALNNKVDDMGTDLKIVKNLLLQMVENNGLKAVK